jgi:hypothetical protein
MARASRHLLATVPPEGPNLALTPKGLCSARPTQTNRGTSHEVRWPSGGISLDDGRPKSPPLTGFLTLSADCPVRALWVYFVPQPPVGFVFDLQSLFHAGSRDASRHPWLSCRWAAEAASTPELFSTSASDTPNVAINPRSRPLLSWPSPLRGLRKRSLGASTLPSCAFAPVSKPKPGRRRCAPGFRSNRPWHLLRRVGAASMSFFTLHSPARLSPKGHSSRCRLLGNHSTEVRCLLFGG